MLQEKTIITIKTDKRIKLKAQKIAHEMGVPLGTLLNAHLKQLVRDGQLIFSITPRMSRDLERYLDGVEEDIRNDRNHSPIFSSAEDAIAYLKQ